jgi:hypothetical protein
MITALTRHEQWAAIKRRPREVAMEQQARKQRLDKGQREVLEALAKAPHGLSGVEIQRRCEEWPIRPSLDSVVRRGLVDHDGYRFVTDRQHTITDAGREAIS